MNSMCKHDISIEKRLRMSRMKAISPKNIALIAVLVCICINTLDLSI